VCGSWLFAFEQSECALPCAIKKHMIITHFILKIKMMQHLPNIIKWEKVKQK
jgi:hypothetical protein